MVKCMYIQCAYDIAILFHAILIVYQAWHNLTAMDCSLKDVYDIFS